MNELKSLKNKTCGIVQILVVWTVHRLFFFPAIQLFEVNPGEKCGFAKQQFIV